MIMYDTDGVTEISYKNLSTLSNSKSLESIFIRGGQTSDIEVIFLFTDGSSYSASGFSIGYAGEGPRGLYRAMQLFIENLSDWDKVGIFKLNPEKNWVWSKNKFKQPDLVSII